MNLLPSNPKLNAYQYSSSAKQIITIEHFLNRLEDPTLFNYWKTPYSYEEHMAIRQIRYEPEYLSTLGKSKFRSIVRQESELDTLKLINDTNRDLQKLTVNELRQLICDNNFYPSRNKSIGEGVIEFILSLMINEKENLKVIEFGFEELFLLKKLALSGHAITSYTGLQKLENRDNEFDALYRDVNRDKEVNFMQPVSFLKPGGNERYDYCFGRIGSRFDDMYGTIRNERISDELHQPVIDAMLSQINDNGKVFLLIAKRYFDFVFTNDLYEDLLEKNLVEAIIELPKTAAIRTISNDYLIILSPHNEKVKFYDATNIVEKDNERVMALDYEKALESYITNDPSVAISLAKDELASGEYTLRPQNNIIVHSLKEKQSKPITEYGEIFSGWHFPRRLLDDIVIREKEENAEGIYLLNMSDINDGRVNLTDVKYNPHQLPSIRGDVAPYRVQNGDIVMSIKTSTVKVAVVQIPDDITLVATSSIVVIRPNTTKLDAYFYAAYLESPEGQMIIDGLKTGRVVENLSLNNAKLLPVPNVPLEDQRAFGKKYYHQLEIVHQKENELQRLRDDLLTLYQNEFNK